MPRFERLSGVPDRFRKMVEPAVGVIPTRPAFIGVDPGASGGLAILSGPEFSLTSMPQTEWDIWNWVMSETACNRRDGQPTYAVIEKVQGFIGAAHPGSAMFKFGMSFGMLKMALTAASIPWEEATPQRWQKALGIVPRKRTESKSQFKNRLKGFAQRLFPKVHVTLATADALLIAEFCRRSRDGK